MRFLVSMGLEMSSRAYSTKQFQGYVLSKPSGCKVLIEKNVDLCVIAFAGSECVTDWVMNFLVKPASFNGCVVHSGFVIQYNSVKHEILTYMSDKPKRVICCGHSLGGAVANLCALDLSLLGYEVQCVTFGSPSVGCAAFRSLFEEKVNESVRVIHFGDPIQYVPLQYMHCGSRVVTLYHPTLRPHSLRSYYNASQKCSGKRERCC